MNETLRRKFDRLWHAAHTGSEHVRVSSADLRDILAHTEALERAWHQRAREVTRMQRRSGDNR